MITREEVGTAAGPSLRLEGVTVRRGRTVVLVDASLDVPAGGAVGIVGPNGSGKTTLLDVISGLVRPQGGTVAIDGLDLTSVPARHRTMRGLARTFQESHLYPQLTVEEAFRVASGGRMPTSQALVPIGLAGRTNAYVCELSTGQRRRLEFAAATARGANVLLLDEPTAGVAPVERERLLDDIIAWRRRSCGTLVIVEHDQGALTRVVDRTVVLEDGRIHEHDVERPCATVTMPDVPVTRPGTIPRPAVAPKPAGPSAWVLARFGLREAAAGMLSVLALGVLNRVMKVELGIPLALVAIVLSAYNLAAPIAIWAGATSDRHKRRVPYIMGGAVVMAATAAVAPFAAFALSPPTVAAVALGIAFFAVMGAGMYGSGAVYFALLSELVTQGRERAIAIVYSMLMAGILAGVAISALVMPTYDPRALISLHGVVALLIVVATWWAVRGAEEGRPKIETSRLRLRQLLGMPGVRRFFTFMIGLIFFAFLQQAVLEPFGGDVFGLNVATTTSFNAIQIVAVLLGMGAAAKWVSPRIGKHRTAAAGAIVAAIGALLLATSGLRTSELLLYAGIIVMGAGMGVLNVGALSLMLDMTARGIAGVSMGLWTVAHALADGAATAGGGVIHTVAESLIRDGSTAYSVVFAAQAVGLLAVLKLLGGVDPKAFEREVTSRRA